MIRWVREMLNRYGIESKVSINQMDEGREKEILKMVSFLWRSV